MTIKTYQQALEYLESFIGKIIFNVKNNPDPLARMRRLLELLGNPEKKFPSVLVGGTSGKGSTATILAQILLASGCKTGLTISPHLQSVTERVQLNCVPISEKEFTQILSEITPVIENMRNETVGAPSYFEIVVAMAFVYFAKQKVDIAVVEVGMGGEFDATNTLFPLVTVLTNVSLDHTQILGNTVEKIARTKAGIIKSYKLKVKPRLDRGKNYKLVVVSGATQPSVIEIIKKRCEEKGALFRLLEKDFCIRIRKSEVAGTWLDFVSQNASYRNLFLSLPGDFQAENAALAIEAVLNLRKFGFVISENDIERALKKVTFAGRFEQIGFRISDFGFKIILDGAHNEAKMKVLLSSVKKLFPEKKKIFVVGFKNDKNTKKLLKQILDEADILILTEYKAKTDVGSHTATPTEKLFEQVKKMERSQPIFAEKNSKKAMKKAFSQGGKMTDSIIIVTGSLYLAGEIRKDFVSSVIH